MPPSYKRAIAYKAMALSYILYTSCLYSVLQIINPLYITVPVAVFVSVPDTGADFQGQLPADLSYFPAATLYDAPLLSLIRTLCRITRNLTDPALRIVSVTGCL